MIFLTKIGHEAYGGYRLCNTWQSSCAFGTWSNRCSSMNKKIRFDGSGQRTGITKHSSKAPTVPLRQSIWRAHAEGKLKFFAWLLVQAKVLTTADKLLVRNWPCNPICPLCDQEPETAFHLCPFAKEVWNLVRSWAGECIQININVETMQEWWEKWLQGQDATKQRTTASILMYSTWNI